MYQKKDFETYGLVFDTYSKLGSRKWLRIIKRVKLLKVNKVIEKITAVKT